MPMEVKLRDGRVVGGGARVEPHAAQQGRHGGTGCREALGPRHKKVPRWVYPCVCAREHTHVGGNERAWVGRGWKGSLALGVQHLIPPMPRLPHSGLRPRAPDSRSASRCRVTSTHQIRPE